MTTRSEAWKSALTVLQEAQPPFVPKGAHAMTIVIEYPPGDPGTPPHRHSGPAFGVAGTRKLMGVPDGVLIGTIVKPNVGLVEDEFRGVVRELARASIDLIKDDELMTDPAYLPLENRVRVALEEISDAEQVTGHRTMYAFNITGDLAGLQRRHDLVVEAGGNCVMLNVPVMGLPALAWLRGFAQVPIHGHRAGLAASMRSPALGVDFTVWQQLARLAGADDQGFGLLGHARDARAGSRSAASRGSTGRGIRKHLRKPSSRPGINSCPIRTASSSTAISR